MTSDHEHKDETEDALMRMIAAVRRLIEEDQLFNHGQHEQSKDEQHGNCDDWQ